MNRFLKFQEERKTTGRLVAIVTALFLLGIAMYQAWIRKTAIIAGVIAPAVIMVLYAAWVVLIAKRDKKRRLLRVMMNGLCYAFRYLNFNVFLSLLIRKKKWILSSCLVRLHRRTHCRR